MLRPLVLPERNWVEGDRDGSQQPPRQPRAWSIAKAILSSTTVLATAVSLLFLAGVHYGQEGLGQVFSGGVHALLEHTSGRAQWVLVWTLGSMGGAGHEALSSLLEHPDRAVRRCALLRWPTGERGAWRRLLRVLSDLDPEIRRIAVGKICEAYPPWNEIEPALTGMAQDPAPSVRYGTAYSLQVLGPAAGPLLSKLCLDSNVMVAMQADCSRHHVHACPTSLSSEPR